MAIPRIDSPLRLTVAYLLFGLIWILGSDGLVAWKLDEGIGAWLVDSAKGLLFIGVTGALLYALTKRLVDRQRRAEEALRESQLRWKFALEGAGDGMWDWNLTTDEIDYSDKALALFGYGRQELGSAAKEWRDRIHPENLGEVEAEVRTHLEGATPFYSCEYRLRCKDGTYKWALGRGQVIARDAAGRPARMIGVVTDITARKAAEESLSNALAFSHAVRDISPVGIIVYAGDGRAVIANEAAARILGTDVPGLLQQNFRELEKWRQHGFLAMAESALRQGLEAERTGEYTSTFGVRRWLDVRFKPFTYSGQKHLLLALQDETEAHRTMEYLQILNAAVQASPTAWVITDGEGKIEWVNPAFTTLTGYTAEEAVGRNPRVLKSGRHSAEFYANLWATIKRGEVWSGEIFNQRKDGGLYHEHMTIAPVRGLDGAITHHVAIKQDITEQKTLQQQLARAQRLESIGMLASGIAHDLNNIFAPILLSLELLKLKYPTADGRKTLELIESAGQRGAGIVRQVLTFARGIDGERVEVHPKYLMKELAQMLAETLPRHIEVETRVPAELPVIEGDATQLHQVLLNLAVNARDAMPNGGCLRLGAASVEVDEVRAARNPPLKPGWHVALTVADTGSGIPPDVLDHMFEPFFTTKPRGKGTGLGLSTVYGIVRSHGGAVEVNTKLGAGTEFTVLLPAKARPAAQRGSASPMPGPLDGAGRRVLVVDDEEPIRIVTEAMLLRFGFTVDLAVDGLEARDRFLCDPTQYAAVITDLMMPRMGGLDLVRAIRRVAPTLPVIVSSGISEEGNGQTDPAVLGELGVHALMRKPYAEPELVKALSREFQLAAAPQPHAGDAGEPGRGQG